MFINNRITRLLGVVYPVIQGGMAWVADADLAAAVSNGGGLGVIAAGSMPPDLLESQIAKVRALTNKPFGVNIMLLSATADAALEVVERNRVPVVTTGAGAPGKDEGHPGHRLGGSRKKSRKAGGRCRDSRGDGSGGAHW